MQVSCLHIKQACGCPILTMCEVVPLSKCLPHGAFYMEKLMFILITKEGAGEEEADGVG